MSDLGAAFADPDVVAHYALRADYPDAAFRRVAERAPGLTHAVDFGCGTGKATRALAQRFQHVTAIDPSAAMLAQARSEAGGQANITWVEGKAEEVDLPRGIDLAFFGECIHWIDYERLFPKLAKALWPDHLLTILTGGDAPQSPDWQDVWDGFLVDWVPQTTGQTYRPGHTREAFLGYRDHLVEVEELDVINGPIRQSLTDFVQTLHSRASFTRARLGDRVDAFDRDLADRLAPFTDAEGALTFSTQTRLVFGRLKSGGAHAPS